MPTRLPCYWWNYMPGDQCWLSGEWLGRSVCALFPCQDEGQACCARETLEQERWYCKHAVFMSRKFVCRMCVGGGGSRMLKQLLQMPYKHPSILLFFAFFWRELQRKTAEEDYQPDPKLPELVCCRWPSDTVHCKKGNGAPETSQEQLDAFSLQFETSLWLCLQPSMDEHMNEALLCDSVCNLSLSQAVNLYSPNLASLYLCMCKTRTMPQILNAGNVTVWSEIDAQ